MNEPPLNYTKYSFCIIRPKFSGRAIQAFFSPSPGVGVSEIVDELVAQLIDPHQKLVIAVDKLV